MKPECPGCQHRYFFEGPHGGLSINVKCANPECGRTWNFMGPFGFDPIVSPASYFGGPSRTLEEMYASRL